MNNKSNNSLTQHHPKVIQAAWNPLRKKLERVHPEDEVPPRQLINMYWSETLQSYVSIPE